MAFVRGREVTQAISRVTFNELIAVEIKDLIGDESADFRTTVERVVDGKTVKVPVRRTRIHGRTVLTRLDEIDALENTIQGLVDGIKKIDPEALASALSQRVRGEQATNAYASSRTKTTSTQTPSSSKRSDRKVGP
jgi:endonuclease YncB( thermonuclease family)